MRTEKERNLEELLPMTRPLRVAVPKEGKKEAMTDSIRGMGACPDMTSASVDDLLRQATGARDTASAAHHAEGHDPTDHLVHLGVEATSATLDVVAASAEGTALGFGLELGGMVAGAAGAWASWAMGPLEGERRGVEYDSEMMRGCLAAFEGRTDEPEVRAFMAESPAFANGVRDAERIAMRDPDLFGCIRNAVVSANEAGANAVYEGTDSDPATTARYESDLAFRHGVDRARDLRTSDPAAFDAARSESGALRGAMLDARSSVYARA
jgi:hypothetical protein